MPIYEYRCKECEHEVEALQKLSDPPLVTCPSCGKPALQKLVSAAGFQLKGSGWYVTDFRGGGSSAKRADKAADAPASDAAKGETKTESATKSESAASTPAPSTSTTPSSSSSSDS